MMMKKVRKIVMRTNQQILSEKLMNETMIVTLIYINMVDYFIKKASYQQKDYILRYIQDTDLLKIQKSILKNIVLD